MLKKKTARNSGDERDFAHITTSLSPSDASDTVSNSSHQNKLNPLLAFKKLTKKSNEPDTRDYHLASPNLDAEYSINSMNIKSKERNRLTPNINFNKLKFSDTVSEGLESLSFGIYELQRYGIVGNVETIAYDPSQSLMAVVTNFNHIYIFGQARVMFNLTLETVTPMRALKFIKGIYLIAIDTSNTIYVISLNQKKVIHTLVALAPITSFACDYSLEFLYVGLHDGTLKAFDIETGKTTILNLREQQTQTFPNDGQVKITSIQIHPRDIGTLLISYPRITIVYNLATNSIINSFIYELEKTAPGGENASYHYESNSLYYPRTTHCLWHPNGLHAVTVYDDNSIVFWDAKTGEKILARTLFDSEIDQPTGQTQRPQKHKMTSIKKIQWLCENNSEKTSILILGGDSYSSDGYHQLVRIDFGTMISYSLSSYSQMAKYYAQPKEQKIFAIHSKAEILDFIPLGETSPYFNYCHDPRLIGVTMSDGSMKFLHYPAGNLLLNAKYFPASVSWLNPKITCSSSSFMNRKVLNSILPSHATQSETIKTSILKGGIPARPRYKVTLGSLIITGHEAGFIRLWDSSEGDLNTSKVFEIDISDILERDDASVAVSNISFANEALEVSCSLKSGDVLFFSYGVNRLGKDYNTGEAVRRMSTLSLNNSVMALNNISDRASPNVKRGFLPRLLIKPMDNGAVTTLNNSNIGLVVVGYEKGRLLVIDKKSNSVAYNELLKDEGLSLPIYATSAKFGFGLGSDDAKPSALLFVGTSIGRLLTYQVQGSPGGYRLKYVNKLDCHEESIRGIELVNSITGRPLAPTLDLMSPNSQSNKDANNRTYPMVITFTTSDIRIIKNNSKIAHKSYSKGDISQVGVTGAQTSKGLAFSVVVILGGSKQLICLNIPALSEISKLRIPYRIDTKYSSQSSVLPFGDVYIRISETEAALVNIMNLRQPIMSMETSQSTDTLFLRNIIVPSRPEMKSIFRNAPKVSYNQLHQLLTGKERQKEIKYLADYELSWDVSCYNPINYTYITSYKPVYFDPNALTQHPQLQKTPIRSDRKSNQKGWLDSVANSVSDSMDAAQNVLDDKLTQMNDDFDDAVSKAKHDAIKGVFSGGLFN